jgi:signal transduction histidine kinase
LGLVAMRERADLLNATLKVENGVRGGTVVRLDVPVDGDLEDNASHE